MAEKGKEELDWEWEAKKDSWIRYDKASNGKLNSGDGPVVALKIEESDLEVDRANMRQKNRTTGFERSVRCCVEEDGRSFCSSSLFVEDMDWFVDFFRISFRMGMAGWEAPLAIVPTRSCAPTGERQLEEGIWRERGDSGAVVHNRPRRHAAKEWHVQRRKKGGDYEYTLRRKLRFIIRRHYCILTSA
jgi:hypothetical protein